MNRVLPSPVRDRGCASLMRVWHQMHGRDERLLVRASRRLPLPYGNAKSSHPPATNRLLFFPCLAFPQSPKSGMIAAIQKDFPR
jgi:hypothetical protein